MKRTYLTITCLLIGLMTIRLDASENYPQIEIVTTSGTIVVELDRNRAPKTVENFLNYVESGAYIGTIFHRVIPGFVIQTGGYDVNLDEIENLTKLKFDKFDFAVTSKGNKILIYTSAKKLIKKIFIYITKIIDLNINSFEIIFLKKIPKLSNGKNNYKVLLNDR